MISTKSISLGTSPATCSEATLRPPRWLNAVIAILFLGVAVVYGYYVVFSRSMSLDEGYLMTTIRSFSEGNPLYDSVFTQYGPFYYAYEWIVHSLLGVPLTHDATRLMCVFHWLTAAAIFGWAGGRMTRSWVCGIFVFAQAAIHLTPLASEPGHPQELVAVLLALGILAASLGPSRKGMVEMLAVLTAALFFTKINVGIFFGLALLLTMRCCAADRFSRGSWVWFLSAGCSTLPFLLMRHHLASEWWRNCSLLVGSTVLGSLLLAHKSCAPITSTSMPALSISRAAIFFFAPSALILGMALFTGSSWRGLMDGLFLTPLKMPGVALLPMPLSRLALLNAAAASALAFTLALAPRWTGFSRLLTILKLLYGLAGALWLLGDAKAQFAWLLPWVWLALPLRAARAPQADSPTVESNISNAPQTGCEAAALPRLFLCLAAAWQSLQVYPIAGTQVTTGTILLVLVSALCLHDVFQEWSLHMPETFRLGVAQLTSRVRVFLGSFALLALLYAFANVWCKLPEIRNEYESLPVLGLPGSQLVRMDAETTGMYRALASYLKEECDTFVTYPGINSLYFWTDKRPPTHLNSTGWGQLSVEQQQYILDSLGRARRPLLVIVAAEAARWPKYTPPQIAPLVRYVFEDCQEVARIGRFIIFRPKGV